MQIRPITDLRDTNKISKICHESKNPVFITKNGYGDLVIMSIDTYNEQLAKANLYHELEKGENDLKTGKKLYDSKEVIRDLKKEHEE